MLNNYGQCMEIFIRVYAPTQALFKIDLDQSRANTNAHNNNNNTFTRNNTLYFHRRGRKTTSRYVEHLRPLEFSQDKLCHRNPSPK